MNYNVYIDKEGHVGQAFQKMAEDGNWLSQLIDAAKGGDAAAQYIYASVLDSTFHLTDGAMNINRIADPNFRRVMQDNITECFDNYMKSAQKGNKFAQYNVAHAYHFGELSCPINKELAIEWYKKSASNGYLVSYAMIAEVYLGRNDVNEAAKWYMIGAEKGEPACQYNCFFNYEYGDGVPKDHQKAILWLKKAAQNGFGQAIEVCEKLGIDYSSKSGFSWLK